MEGVEFACKSLCRIWPKCRASSLDLDMDQSTSEIYRIANGTYVHVYRSSSTLKCSSLNLRTANCFFNFTDNREPIPAVSSVDRTTFDSGVRSWHLSSVGGRVLWESRREQQVHVGRGACCSMVLDRRDMECPSLP